MDKFLVISEVSKKQGYIFKTNKLKENIGASAIIEYITEDLPKKNLKKVLGKEDIEDNIVNTGGGNSLFIVDSEKDAKKFIKWTTSQVLKEFPGVEFFMAYHKFDYEKNSIIDAIDEIYKKLNDKKSARASVFRRKSYGIEQECVTTGLPAYKRYDGAFLSRESYIKREWSKDDHRRELIQDKTQEEKSITISGIIDKYEKQGYKFTNELEQLITEKGDNSYVAIVSLDGNKMGQKIEHMKKEAKKREDKNNMPLSNDKYRDTLTEFSKNIKKYYSEAFDYMLKTIHENYYKVEKELKLEERNKKEKGKKIMPVRPIILAGDDVCFICNAKIALECVNLFITKLNEREHDVEGEQLNACAGICMLKSTYPFDKGYEIAENLCKNGKAKIVDSNDASLVDFHICQGEISTSLNEIRSKVSIDKEIELNVKPLYINITEITEDDKQKDSYKKIQRIITEENTFNTYEKFKKEFNRVKKIANKNKGKVRKLRDVFPQGQKQTRIFMNKNMISDKFNFGFDLPKGSKIEYGFYEKDGKQICLYFDIIELQDMFINLDY